MIKCQIVGNLTFISKIIVQFESAAKLSYPCNSIRTSNSFGRCDTGVVIDSEPHPSCMCKTSFLFFPLAVGVHTGCSAFPFCTPTKPLIQ